MAARAANIPGGGGCRLRGAVVGVVGKRVSRGGGGRGLLAVGRTAGCLQGINAV